MNIPAMPLIIIRHSPPGKLDHAQIGTKCHVLRKFESRVDVYQQVSNHEDDPAWEFVGIEEKES